MLLMAEVLMRVCVLVFMLGSLGGVGLRVARGDVLAPLKQGRFVAVSLVTSWVVCPVLAVLVLHFVPLAQPYEAGLLLLALAPCAPFAPLMVRIARGDASYLAAFMVLSAITTVIFMPIGVPLLIPGAAVSPWPIARPLLLLVLLPLMAGLAIKDRMPAAAARLRPPLEKVTAVAGVAMLVLIVILYGPGVVDAIGSYAIAAHLIFLTGATVITQLMGAALPAAQRSVVTLGTCTRNLGAALAPIAVVAPDPRGVVMIAIGALVTLVWSAVLARRLAPR